MYKTVNGSKYKAGLKLQCLLQFLLGTHVPFSENFSTLTYSVPSPMSQIYLLFSVYLKKKNGSLKNVDYLRSQEKQLPWEFLFIWPHSGDLPAKLNKPRGQTLFTGSIGPTWMLYCTELIGNQYQICSEKHDRNWQIYSHRHSVTLKAPRLKCIPMLLILFSFSPFLPMEILVFNINILLL